MHSYFYEMKRYQIMIRKLHTLAFPPHIHEHLEFVYILRGSTIASVNFKDYTLHAGDAFLAFPNQIHAYREDEDLECYLIIFSARFCEEFSPLFTEKEPLHPSYSTKSHLLHTQIIAQQMLDIYQEQSLYYEEKLKGLLMLMLADMFENLHFADKKAMNRYAILEVLDYCQENFKNDISLQSMSTALGKSPSYLSHLMAERLHMGFRDYINYLRVAEAERLLQRKKTTITNIAMQVGFNSTRSFNRVFKMHTGRTPKQVVKGDTHYAENG